jgi:RAB6A-GEF complex partner protein 2
MMGYAQLRGNFMIDEALINPTGFDEVKAKAILGGKSGGGVVGVDSRRTASWTGLTSLSTFGLGSLFGSTQPSSLAEMRDDASSKLIPILSTPPSILFVDLRLAPGESKSFSYTFKLPRNLPPSHYGRALRISYSLIVTTQRPGMSSQHLSTAEIPFRLFSNLDGLSHRISILIIEYGSQPKYDLKSPIILLRDEAKTAVLKDAEILSEGPRSGTVRRSSTYSDKPIESSQDEFMSFLQELLGSLGKAVPSTSDTYRLDVPRTPSPTPTKERFRTLSCREVIDVILQRGMGVGSRTKVGVFEIGKDGVTVAKLTLPRTTFKLGETIEGVVNLENEGINCYHVCTWKSSR